MGFRKRNEAQAQEPVKETPKKEAPKASGGKTYHNNVLTIVAKKDGGVFLKINERNAEGVEIRVNGKVVTGIMTSDPIADLEDAVDKGRMDAKKAEELAKKLQNILGNVTLVTD